MPATDHTDAAAAARFDAALRLGVGGDWLRAAAALEAIAHASVDDPYSDDALYEAATAYEERLGQPARAEQLFREVTTRFPSSRLAPRARARAERLSRALGTGAAALVEYEAILRDPALPRAETYTRLSALLEEAPDFALADEGLLRLAAMARELGRPDEGLHALERLLARLPSSPLVPEAQALRGELLLATHRPLAARALYRTLLDSPSPLLRATAEDGLAAVHRWLVQALLFVLAVGAFGGYLFCAAWRLPSRRSTPTRLPLELSYYLPLALLVSLAALRRSLQVGLAAALLATGGSLLLWSVARSSAPGQSQLRRLRALTALLAAIVGLLYAALYTTDLLELVIETLRSGPER